MSDLAIQIHKFVLANKRGEEKLCSLEDVTDAFPTHSEDQVKKALHELGGNGYIRSFMNADNFIYYVFSVIE